ncbi:hypothetical protein MKZ08_09880 [Viridibacillus sp. FSL R5-0477]|uniref:hypothetical protein n=1 Tax=Viridibacillus TaxID=496496 RepID=UPI0004AF0C20|nr:MULTISPECIES: hypothetical protein [Viridibacillus]
MGEKSIEWGIVTELEVVKAMVRKIAFVHSYADLTFIEELEECSVYEFGEMAI